MVGAPAKKKPAFAKAASIPARRQSENAGPRLFWIYSSMLPPISNIFFRFFELSTKAAFAKAAFDTLRDFFLTMLKCGELLHGAVFHSVALLLEELPQVGLDIESSLLVHGRQQSL